MIVSVVILSYSIDEVIYRMNLDCIQSLMQSEDWQSDELEIILIESNTCCDYEYPLEVTVLVPDEPFNFHRFLNIGIRSSHGELIALCNNDILFHKGWYSELQRVKELHPEFLCFSPIDRARSEERRVGKEC